jgi:hypothetical protein
MRIDIVYFLNGVNGVLSIEVFDICLNVRNNVEGEEGS